MSDDNRPVTLVLGRAAMPSRDDALRQWMRQMVAAGASANGFVGSVQLGRTGALQHLLIRSRSRAKSDQFQRDKTFSDAKARGEALATGLDPGRGRMPRRCRTAKRCEGGAVEALRGDMAVGAAGIADRQHGIAHAVAVLPSVLQVVASSLVLTSLLQWVILPRVQRAARAWTPRNAAGRLRT